MGHTLQLAKGNGATWDYSCSCGKAKRPGLKNKSSAAVIHAAHVRAFNATKSAVKSK